MHKVLRSFYKRNNKLICVLKIQKIQSILGSKIKITIKIAIKIVVTHHKNKKIAKKTKKIAIKTKKIIKITQNPKYNKNIKSNNKTIIKNNTQCIINILILNINFVKIRF